MKVVESIREWAAPVAGGVAGIAVGLFACKLVRDKYFSDRASSSKSEPEKEPLTSNKNDESAV